MSGQGGFFDDPEHDPAPSLYPKPRSVRSFDGLIGETEPLVGANGFREYDARWVFGAELNLMGAQAVGFGLGTLVHEAGVRPEIVVGHDFRSYSAAIKFALATGLIAAGVRVRDIGLALTPMAYFAQFELDCPCVAMVTASHNENGWTGVKMGMKRPLTFGPEEMSRLKAIVLDGAFRARDGGSYAHEAEFPWRYLKALLDRPRLKRPIKVVAACGNGTAGAFAPEALERLGCEVVPLDAELDFTFPKYNPNPEDLKMLQAIREAVLEHRADVGFGFDGDGDRCGVVDDEGEAIFSDKIGVLLARDLAAVHPGARFVVDVKSTGLYATDPVLLGRGATTDYWKTGHSYIKRRVNELGALAGFEKSGHFFFNRPIGLGYDDGLLSAFAVCDLLDRNPDSSLADLRRLLPMTWGTPTMSPHCADETKYGIVEKVTADLSRRRAAGEPFAGGAIYDLVTVNGVRVTASDGTWGLVRASSNKPELVIVAESPVSEARMREMFDAIDATLREHPEVGQYNQTM